MKNFLGLLFQRRGYRVGEGMRGRVHKISIIAGGEVSIVIRCGMDEPHARHLLQGSLVEFFETREGVAPAIPNTVSPPPPDTAPPLPVDPLMTESGDMIERRIECEGDVRCVER